MKIYVVRHQAAGMVMEFPFSSAPSPEQLAPIHSLLDGRHGKSHPKTGETHWARVVEIDVIGPGEMPQTEPPVREGKDITAGGVGSMPLVSGHGVAHVVNPK